jgi:hypothetical protein
MGNTSAHPHHQGPTDGNPYAPRPYLCNYRGLHQRAAKMDTRVRPHGKIDRQSGGRHVPV